jgi:hypothetical protein
VGGSMSFLIAESKQSDLQGQYKLRRQLDSVMIRERCKHILVYKWYFGSIDCYATIKQAYI